MPGKSRAALAALVVIAVLLAAPVPPSHAADSVLVFAAASLKNAVDAVAAAWQADEGKTATISYAASPALARQIEQGAPADLFISADLDWMKYLADRKLIKQGSEVRLLGNRLVLIAPRDSTAKAAIAPGFDLAGLLGDGKLAMGDVKAVPAGKYGKAALETLGVWKAVEGNIAQAENVRAALKLVSIGEAPLGIVYRTDAVAEPGVKVVGTFPEDAHPPIVYPAGLTVESANPDAAGFVKYLQSAKARQLFEAQGFTVLTPVASN
ncbi:MAG: molybdate ABC transporter substrate-binding protein [Pseudaminobacter sp.]|nr:molybdate ABC transporter substrate-binding protein [Pseudaminobacter sp.]